MDIKFQGNGLMTQDFIDAKVKEIEDQIENLIKSIPTPIHIDGVRCDAEFGLWTMIAARFGKWLAHKWQKSAEKVR